MSGLVLSPPSPFSMPPYCNAKNFVCMKALLVVTICNINYLGIEVENCTLRLWFYYWK